MAVDLSFLWICTPIPIQIKVHSYMATAYLIWKIKPKVNCLLSCYKWKVIALDTIGVVFLTAK